MSRGIEPFRSRLKNYKWNLWIKFFNEMKVIIVKRIHRSSHPEVFLVKVVLKICSKFTGEHPCRSVISIKLQSNFIEIALRHGCSPLNLLHIFRTPFARSTSRWLLLNTPEINKEVLVFSFISVIQAELNEFMRIWNCHKMKK